jgi:type IV secretory pathway VirB3-like protein
MKLLKLSVLLTCIVFAIIHNNIALLVLIIVATVAHDIFIQYSAEKRMGVKFKWPWQKDRSRQRTQQ